MFRNSKKLGRGVSFLTSSLLAVSSLLLPTAASASPYTLTCSQSVSDPDTPFSLAVGDEVLKESAQDCAGVLTIPEGVKKIGFGAFVPWTKDGTNSPLSNDKITSISIPSSLTEIFVGGFINLSSVQSLVIPSNVITIGHQAFQGMTSLDTITIQGSSTSTPTTIDYFALNLATVDLTLGSGKIELKDIFGAGATFESVDLGTGLISIGKSAFRGQTFSELRIPQSVETIDQQAFAQMPNLREIEFGPNTPGITSIDASAFSGTNITSVQYCGGNSALDSYLAANLPAADVYCDATVLPSVPSVVSATSGANEVVLTVALGAENAGPAPSNFAVEFSSDSTNWVSYVRSPASSSTTIAVPGLTNETSYVFRVSAINSSGSSPYSSISASVSPRATRYQVTFLAGVGSGTPPSDSNEYLPGSAAVLPVATGLTKANFTFSGWSDGVVTYQSGASYILGANDVNLTAQWVQDSLFGLDPADMTLLGSLTAGAIDTAISGSSGGSTVTVNYLSGSLPTGTVININLLTDTSRARSLITETDSFIASFIVSWLATDGTVPDTQVDKPLTMTIVNSQIKAGASVYSVVGNVATEIESATTDGQVTISIYRDPEIVIAIGKPGAPTNVQATSGDNSSSTIAWAAPASNGGGAITSYLVTSSQGQTCTTATLTCTVTGLTNGTSYTFSVTATNSAGAGPSSTASSSMTPIGSSSGGSGGSGGDGGSGGVGGSGAPPTTAPEATEGEQPEKPIQSGSSNQNPKPWKPVGVASSFAPGSAAINSIVKSQIILMIRKFASHSSALQCVGYTSGPTVLKSDARLSKARADAVCNLIKKLRPRLTVLSAEGKTGLIVGGSVRRVEITFTRN
jgi:hypothetical protein